jgi:LysM repeat protein
MIAGLLAAAPMPALHAQDSAAQIASMSEDIQLLTRKVDQLNLQVETLSQNNAQLQKQIVSQHDVQLMVQNALAQAHGDTHTDITQSNSALRKEILDEVAKQIDALTKDTNKQLQKLAQAMQTTAPATSTGTGTSTAAGPAAPQTFSDDYPRTGIEYVIQSGDSLGKIARKNGSTIKDIVNANHISDPNKGLQVGKTIFVPQKNPTPKPAATPTAPAAPASPAAPSTT